MQFDTFIIISNRLSSVLGCNSLIELADKLDVKYDQLKNWRSRNSMPFPVLIESCNKYNLNLIWVLTGKGKVQLPDNDEEIIRLKKENFNLAKEVFDLENEDQEMVLDFVRRLKKA